MIGILKKAQLACVIGAIVLLPIDNFPLGQQLLREFGTRPSNFFLMVYIAIGCLFIRKITLKPDTLFLLVFSAISSMLPFVNFFISDIPNGRSVLGRPSETQWILQTAMLIWMLVSLWIWSNIWLKYGNHPVFWGSIVFSVIIQLWFFFADISMWLFNGKFDLVANRSIQTFFGGDHDIFRPAGLASEPSLYASWVLLIWPLLLLRGQYTGIRSYPLLALVLIASGIASTSRTFLAILALQIPIVLLGIYRVPSISKIMAGMISIPVLICGILFFWQSNLSKAASIFDESQSMSTLARKSGQAVSRIVFEDFPVPGVGLGQFSAHYPEAVPYKYLASREVQEWASGTAESRVSTFNVFWRVLVEFGAILSTILMLLVACTFTLWTSKFHFTASSAYILGSTMGGMSFFLQQDQFGYQPGILAGAIMTSLIVKKWSNEK